MVTESDAKVFPINTYLRNTALRIAIDRDEIARKLGRVNEHSSYPGYESTVEMHWIGLLAEMPLEWFYPDLHKGQEWVVDSIDTNKPDFIYKGQNIEVKCHTWYKWYETYFVEKRRWDKKKDVSKFLFCCMINDVPQRATVSKALGWIEAERVDTYLVDNVKAWAAEAYAIPVTDLKPMDDFFKEGVVNGKTPS